MSIAVLIVINLGIILRYFKIKYQNSHTLFLSQNNTLFCYIFNSFILKTQLTLVNIDKVYVFLIQILVINILHHEQLFTINLFM